jgi:hypothetical protein
MGRHGPEVGTFPPWPVVVALAAIGAELVVACSCSVWWPAIRRALAHASGRTSRIWIVLGHSEPR